MKYRLSPRAVLRAESAGSPEGSGKISLYTPPLITIQLQTENYHKVTFRNDIMSIFGLDSGYTTKYGLSPRGGSRPIQMF